MTPLQQVIDNEFNMAMLMKHNELRLIEQELAKCQVALEQLRRCELRPYPGYDCPSSDVTAGTGPAIAPGPGMSRPAYPPPHGVTDGPYSRHYRQWLLRDPEFDSAPMHMYSSMDTPTSAGGRSTRNLGSARKSVSSRTHAVTNRIDSLPSIPNYPAPAPKDKSAPLVLRRSTDNQLVKLICNNCLRGNFSSIQGFLNHCRIAHKVDYKSHDLAAIDCGRLLDEADLAKLPAETHSLPVAGTPTPKAHGSRAASNASSKLAASTPVAAASKSLPALVVPTPTQPQHREMAKGFVHALNSPSATLPTPPSSVARRRAPVKSKSTFQARATSSLPPPALSITTSTNDKSSTTAPRLSAHFAKQGFRPEMFAQAFANAKQSMDETFSQFDSCGGDSAMMTPVGTPSDEDVDSPLMFQRQPQNSTRPARPSLLIAPTTTASTTSKSTESSTLGLAANAPSPSTTSSTSSLSHANSPHLLPGLVSDHEDDDDHSHVDDHDDDVVMVDSVVDLDSHFADAVQDDHHHHHHHHENNDEDEDDDVVVVACKANGKN
jgi:ADA HAT complex component 1